MKTNADSIRPLAMLLTLTLLLGSLTIQLPKAAAENIQSAFSEKTPSAFSDAPLSANESELDVSYDKTPLVFEENRGQADARVKFAARAGSYTLYLTPSEVVFTLQAAASKTQVSFKHKAQRTKFKDQQSDVLRMQFVGAASNAGITGVDKQVGTTNFYRGKNAKNWKTRIPNFAGVKYKSIYEGVDLVFYGKERALEYDFTVAPNADAGQIRLAFDGADKLSLDGAGNLLVKTAHAEITQAAPFMYQEVGGQKQKVAGRFILRGEREVGFEIGEYDRSRPLVIDPALTYLTYMGGTAFDEASDVKVDANGNAYVVGSTNSLDFPTPGSRTADDKAAVYVAKIDPTGSRFLYITFLDGSEDDTSIALALSAQNEVYIGGDTESHDFPVTSGAFDTDYRFNVDAFVAKLNAEGVLVYATFYGGIGAEDLADIAVDASGKAYFVGDTLSTTGNFPLKNQYQNCGRLVFPISANSIDPFLGVLNADGSDLTYSTCFGGSGYSGVDSDSAFGVAVDAANNAYITGETGQNNFPTKNAIQASNAGGFDGFVAKLNPALSGDASLIYSTYLGGSGTDEGISIAVSASGSAYVTGQTGSINFPLKNALRSTNQVNEAFVTVLDPNGTLVNSTFLGGNGDDIGNSIVLGNGGTVYVGGSTKSSNFPLATPFLSTRSGSSDGFVTKLRLTGEATGISSSTLLGGNGLDGVLDIALSGAHIIAVGNTASNNLPTVSPNPIFGPIKATSNASLTNLDGFVAKILDTRKDTVGVFHPTNTVFSLKNTLSGGGADITVDRGAAGDVPVAGDFNGDGIDTVSTFNNGTWTIRNFNVQNGGYVSSTIVSSFGQAGDLPVTGDWDGDGLDSLGVFRPSTRQFFLSNDVINPAVDFAIVFGLDGDLPVAGDWNGDGIDSVGVFRPSQGTFFLTNQNIPKPSVNLTAFFGTAEDLPVAGDWDGNGKDTIGVWRPSTTTFFLSDDNVNVLTPFVFGAQGDKPVAGDWDGKP